MFTALNDGIRGADRGIELRPVVERDEDLIFEAIESGLRRYVEALGGEWRNSERRDYCRERMRPGLDQIVCIDGSDAGYLALVRNTDHLELEMLCLLPRYQRRGIGTVVLRNLEAEADAKALPLRLRVFAANRAAAWYGREGFMVTESGDDRLFMEYSPSPTDSPARRRHDVGAYMTFVRPCYTERDRAHDFRRIERIVALLWWLAEGLPRPLDRGRLAFLAAFHGLDKRLGDDAQLRADSTAFLADLGWSPEEREELFRLLARHSSDPQTAEERMVHDANHIELLGAFGIAKSFTTGGALRQSYEQSAAILTQYLDEVKFRTPAAQRIAARKIAYAKEFLQALPEEL